MVPKALLCFLLFGAAMAAVMWPTTTQCNTLCTQYMTNCSSTYDIYTDLATCELECSRFPLTTTCSGQTPPAADGCTEADGENSYDCRLYHLGVALSSPSNLATHCPHSTPLSSKAEANLPNSGPCVEPPVDSAVDSPMSGTIEDLCNNLVATCGSLFSAGSLTMQYCYNAMYNIPGIADVSTYPMDGSPFPVAPMTPADNFLCRRYHVDVAGTSSSNAMTHCPHAFMGDGQCGENCNFYCDIMQNVCLDTTAAGGGFATLTDCMTACQAYDSTSVDFSMPLPTVGNTLNCRIYHATVAAQGPSFSAVHCQHAGMVSTTATCGASGAFAVSASLFLVAVLAFFSLN